VLEAARGGVAGVSGTARSHFRPTGCSRSTIAPDGAAVFIVSAICAKALPRPVN